MCQTVAFEVAGKEKTVWFRGRVILTLTAYRHSPDGT
jgi:hypothetical protein